MAIYEIMNNGINMEVVVTESGEIAFEVNLIDGELLRVISSNSRKRDKGGKGECIILALPGGVDVKRKGKESAVRGSS